MGIYVSVQVDVVAIRRPGKEPKKIIKKNPCPGKQQNIIWKVEKKIKTGRVLGALPWKRRSLPGN